VVDGCLDTNLFTKKTCCIHIHSFYCTLVRLSRHLLNAMYAQSLGLLFRTEGASACIVATCGCSHLPPLCCAVIY
jgi:hypothetical protein